MYPEDVDPESGCRLPLPRRDELDDAGQRIYDTLAAPESGTIRGLRGPDGILLHSPDLSRHTRPVNRYPRYEAGLGGRVRELAILTTARELDSQFQWAAHEPQGDQPGHFPGNHRHHQIPQGHERPGRSRCYRHRAGPRDLRCEEGVGGDLHSGLTAIRPPRFSQSRRPHGQLCRDSSASHCLRHAARSGSVATLVDFMNSRMGVLSTKMSQRATRFDAPQPRPAGWLYFMISIAGATRKPQSLAGTLCALE